MTGTPDDAELLDAELSLLAFQRRVLALAEDPGVPLLERLRFLGIVTSNIDELYMVRMVELRAAAVDAQDDGGRAAARLSAVERDIGDLLVAQTRAAERCLREVAAHGVRIVSWSDLDATEREALRAQYLREIQPDLMSHAITLSPGTRSRTCRIWGCSSPWSSARHRESAPASPSMSCHAMCRACCLCPAVRVR
jgi:polyphosphate kinase